MARIAPNWMTIENILRNGSSAGSRRKPISALVAIRCPVDEIGRNSVSPSTAPITTALKASVTSIQAPAREHASGDGRGSRVRPAVIRTSGLPDFRTSGPLVTVPHARPAPHRAPQRWRTGAGDRTIGAGHAGAWHRGGDRRRSLHTG